MNYVQIKDGNTFTINGVRFTGGGYRPCTYGIFGYGPIEQARADYLADRIDVFEFVARVEAA